jgi:GNAT superfamily N-acetyltransferase
LPPLKCCFALGDLLLLAFELKLVLCPGLADRREICDMRRRQQAQALSIAQKQSPDPQPPGPLLRRCSNRFARWPLSGSRLRKRPPSKPTAGSSARQERIAGHPDAGAAGKALIEAVYAELRHLGIRRVGLSVISSNADASSFYDRLGLHRFLISYLGNVPGGGR